MEVSRRDTQKRAIEKIAAYASNNNKATTIEYKVRRDELTACWSKFQELHDAVVSRSGTSELAEQENILELVREVYLTACVRLDYYIEQLSKIKKPDKTLALRQEGISTVLTTIIEKLNDKENQMDLGTIKSQTKEVDALYTQFQQIMFDRIAQGDEETEVLDTHESVRETYLQISSLLHSAKIIAEHNHHPPTIAPNTSEDIRLPPLQINYFDGQSEKWESFRDSFREAFHVRTSMPAVQKLQHLKALLRGEAEELVANFALTNANYEQAWNLLNSRYDNKKELVRAHMRIIMNLPKCADKPEDLRKLVNKMSSTLLALRNLGRPVDHWNDWIVHLIVDKIDNETRKLWEQEQGTNDEFATWCDLETFLMARVRALNAVGISTPSIVGRSSLRSAAQSTRAHHTMDDARQPNDSTGPSRVYSCPCCAEDHAIFYCTEFRSLTANERRQIVADKKLCFSCFGNNHLTSRCTSNFKCRFCNQQHNSLLHINDAVVSSAHLATASVESEIQGAGSVLLATAVVNLCGFNGQWYQVRALLDQGSQSSFMTENCAQMLNLTRRKTDVSVIGVGAGITERARHVVTAIMSSNSDDNFQLSIEALILPRISASAIREICDDERSWPHLNELRLADPNFLQGQRIELLIGADVYGLLLRPEIIRGPIGSPIAQNTVLGWIVSGPIKPHQSVRSNEIIAMHSSVDNTVAQFWEIEEVSTQRLHTALERECEEKYNETFRRDETGRFHVRIPFTAGRPIFGASLHMAIQRQHQMERKFLADSSFAEKYRQFMFQYHELGHMELTNEPISRAQPSPEKYYIPHHAVIKESSSTTKLRVVFDASRKSSNGQSLNEQMMIGPRLQDDLSSIVMRWRKHSVVFTADVEQMYRQIKIDLPDSDTQRIVWRSSTMEAMQIYRLTTVTYGTASAPYLAVKSLQKLAQLERSKYPIGAAIAEQDFYVDDVLSGCDNIVDAMEAQSQLRSLLRIGGFNLRKWTSNHEELLNHLPSDELECRVPLNINLDQQIKTLGIQWNPATDCFQFKITLPDSSKMVTKRQFLSEAAKLYDPLGWLAPCIIIIKSMFQELWKDKLDWDDKLSSQLTEKWINFRASLKRLEKLQITRWIGCNTQSHIEIHGFCDASAAAYAASVYIRIGSEQDPPYHVHLLCAKTKVAPLKTISIPRLELCGAVLLCKLLMSVKTAMKFKHASVNCWTDSTIALAWIKGNPARWNVFVGNRITEIQANFPISLWRHVTSDQNPADCATRGVSPAQLIEHPIWWTGPNWLSMDKIHWPKETIITETSEERRKSIAMSFTATCSQSWNLIEQFSSWNRLARVTAYCIRFGWNLRRSANERRRGALCPIEMQTAKQFWIKIAQKTSFSAEINQLQKGEAIASNSSLRSLNPQLHDDGLLHVGGRLINSLVLPEQSKTPVIIPRYSRISSLLIAHAHEHTLHGGPSLMLAQLRRQFWIVDGPRAIRQYVKKCNTCFRFTATSEKQVMSSLPAARITPSRPFLHTAMDYSGAVMVRSARGRGHHATKGYVAVFVCLSTKAVHIELVSDLTSNAFIAAYKRFVGRRGVCSDLYSDNATNYVGAAAIFCKTERDIGFSTEMINSLSTMGTKWHFSPPLSPHFNGLAESAIRSVKHHIRRVVGTTTLTFEELLTVLIQIESCLNSRPLYPCSSDPTDFEVLTPGHFLVGSPLSAIPQRNLLDHNSNLLNRWQMIQQMVQRFWKQWSAEYLHTLQQRKKWQNEIPNIKIGDLVLVIEDNLPPSKWAIGRVVDTHPGRDGCVRVVSIRTRDQTYKRAVVKVARLPTQHE